MTRSALIVTDDTDLDLLAQFDGLEVAGRNLRDGMVILDPDLGTPAIVLDHKQRGSNGAVQFFAEDVEAGGRFTFRLLATRTVTVAAR